MSIQLSAISDQLSEGNWRVGAVGLLIAYG